MEEEQSSRHRKYQTSL